MADIFGALARDWNTAIHHPHHSHAATSQTPAPGPVTLAKAQPATEAHMTITTIEDVVKRDLTEGAAYVEQWISRVKAAAPAIIETAETVGGSTVQALVESLAGRVLPPTYEQIAVDFLKDLADKYAQPEHQADTTPAEQPEQPQYAAGPTIAGQA